MAMTKLKLMPIEPAPVMAIVREGPDFIVQFNNHTQCLITQDKAQGNRALYPFAKDIVGKWPWVVQIDDLVIVANMLVFQIVHEEHVLPGVSTLFCVYRGMVS